ncbi:HD-GYP domain-containing protein (c-di-GMP phosphodiesterase class II) [Pelomonas saccharophila]|uniref:HD-GYP domain-containing protein (C-di-GMP phosphodiesterase class II) n=1 Tax=Roseateles saccharophilus TaxID=304 RepID=A0ABU1YSV5_ROSSA|nr:HD domain-containing phosphohydrolase [Roseateles saccharophilus]MDR7271325.1 HD-GYP domain-containing protein (c-di-GMP phosphodiesterase class II) [Roseateles saccharophilus]
MRAHSEAVLAPGAADAGPAVDHHGLRTAWLAGRIARFLELDAATVEGVEEAASFHDVGKRFVDESVLSKPGRLDAGERHQVEMHVVFGAWTLLSGGPPRRLAAQVALLHHEWWNGRGYPFGLARLAIPLAARITAVADVFDALSEERCYKPAWPLRDVMAYVASQRGRQFDPRCADAMREVAARLPVDWHQQALGVSSLGSLEISSVPTLLQGDELSRGMHTRCFV